MIAYLSGKLAQKGPTHLVVDVGGVGYFVHIPLSSYDRVGEVGEQVHILTYLHVKEDGMELFGFATEEERELFRTLVSVSGVGPKLAQAVLSAMSPEEFRRAVAKNDLGRLTSVPGIGRKTAQRLTFFLLKEDGERASSLAEAILALKERIKHCSVCFNITEEDPCPICRDPRRDRSTICVVEEPSDLMAIERLGVYKGVYHVLGGVLSPLDGVGPEDLHIRELLERLKEGVREVILATNPTVEGEATALYLSRLIRPLGIKVSQIARGIPMGGDIELADEMTLARAFEGRREVGKDVPQGGR